MATSSILTNIRITNPKKVEDFAKRKLSITYLVMRKTNEKKNIQLRGMN